MSSIYPRRAVVVAVLLLVLFGTIACGGSDDDNSAALAQGGGITVVDAWVRPADIGDAEQDNRSTDATPASEHDHSSSVTSAIYLTLENTGDTDQQLVSVETDVADMAEIHETTDNAGTMQMRPVDGIDVPAGERIEMTPGGMHIMLMGLHKSLKAGDHIDVMLMFDSGLMLEFDNVEVRDQ
ncbi:MAG: copper chaperone PCu(A)C [Thermomicrobiales bacterium]|nr:copper chaperone PCu(A)C [Thermomicrobiales bacterium]